MSAINPYDPPQTVTSRETSDFPKKLLIVLAIQFCMPALAELLHRVVPATPWLLPIVVINAVCFSSACCLLWPRWRWMLGTAAVASVFCLAWLEVYLYSQNYFADYAYHNPNFRMNFYITLVRSMVLTSAGTVILFYHHTLICNPPRDTVPKRAWQMTRSSLLYYAGCAALVIGAAAKLYDPESADILGYAINDLCLLALTMTVFFHLLQPTINWRSFCLMIPILGFIWLQTDPMINTFWPLHEANIYMIVAVSYSIFTVLLYRWAGFRIVPRRELTPNPPLAEAI